MQLPLVEHTMTNGLRLVVQPDPRLPLVAVNLWYHVGSKNERPGRTGLAHLFEHMLFQGSQNVGTNDHFAYLQQIGGVANGSTWFDRTNYYETVPSSELDLALWLESDRMGFFLPALTQEKLDNQQDVVINERRQRVDNQPYGRALERLHEILYPAGHPYRWPVIGYTEDIEAATLEDVQEFFRTYYAPNNAVVTLVGDVDPDSAIDSVASFFEEIPPGPKLPTVQAVPEVLPQNVGEELPDRVSLPRLYTACRTAGFGKRDWFAADLLTTALSGGKSSPLYRDLVYERQLAQDVQALVFPTELEATLLITATGRPETELGQIEQLILGHLETWAEKGPPAGDLARARKQTLVGLADSLQGFDQRADILSQHATFLGDPAAYARTIERYKEVTAAEVQSAASTLVQAARASVYVVPAG